MPTTPSFDGKADRDGADVQAALTAARAGESESIESLAKIVRIKSLTGEEGPAQEFIAERLRELGADVTIAEPNIELLFRRFPHVAQYPTHWQHDLVLPYDELPTLSALQASGLADVLNYSGRPNVLGVIRGTGGGRSLILNGHVDTVTIEPAASWTKAPFGAEIINGCMYGRGTSDMKGGLMAALMALTYLHRAGVRLKGDVFFHSVVNEEHAGNGTLDLVRWGPSADAAIVLEPTRNTISVSHPGGLYWQVEIPGIPRSPGARWKNGSIEGISAIEKVPAVVEALLAVEKQYCRHQRNASLDWQGAPFSMVIGKIEGGFYETVTAESVILKGSAYFAPHVGSVIDVMQRLREAISSVNERDDFLRRTPARLSFLHHDDSTSQSVDIPPARTMAAILRERGGDPEIKPGSFCCDMRHLANQAGIPSIIFGPGTIEQAHKPDEHIILSEYLAAIEHLIVFICRWCNGSKAEMEVGKMGASNG
jgi:acetylornithine deacetylase